MAPGSSAADVKRTATNLVSTLDSDRSGKLSFEEFAFRFGRKLQMELAKKRRAGLTSPDAHASAAGRAPAPAHEDLVEVNHGALLDDSLRLLDAEIDHVPAFSFVQGQLGPAPLEVLERRPRAAG